MTDPRFRHDPFGRIERPPAANDADVGDAAARRAADHAGRVRRMGSLLRFADAILAGEVPDQADAIFVASALDAWSREPGNVPLERVLGVATPRGSKLTPAELAARIRRADHRR